MQQQFQLKHKKDQIRDALVDAKLITLEAWQAAEAASIKKKIDIFEHLLNEDLVEEESLTQTMGSIAKLPYVNLITSSLDPTTLDLLPFDIASQQQVVPLGVEGDKLLVAMIDIDDLQKINYLSQRLARPLKICIASKSGIQRALNSYKVNINTDELTRTLEQYQQDQEEQEVKKNKRTSILNPLRRDSDKQLALASLEEESPSSKALSYILKYAIQHRCSDIHIEALEESVRVRVRTDGVLTVIATLPKELEAGLVAKIKIESRLKVDEKRLPQDGEFSVSSGGKVIDLRIAISPTVFGEQVIMRILDRSGLDIGLDSLGYNGSALKTITGALKESSGMILTSGPTGSGKTTTLYALLTQIKSDAVKIITLEDPAEYKMDGISQIQINSDIGLTFAAGLRSILRQDPDVVMVGEIRDKETALLAIQASLTGHLVLSTLHTNSAAGILPRLLDMGIEPFLISSTIRVVIGQRLVRRLDEQEVQYDASPEQVESIQNALQGVLSSRDKSAEETAAINANLGYKDLPRVDDSQYTLYKSANENDINQGYKGRIGIYEAFPVTETIQGLINQRESASIIQKAAQSEGMVTMRQDGYLKALAGITTTLEVDRVISANNV